MVFLADWEAKGRDHVFTYGIFGVQYINTPTDRQKETINTLYQLLITSAGRVDHLRNEAHGTDRNGMLGSTTFVAYWLESSAYHAWSTSPAFLDFWNGLAEDAGVWREVMTLPVSRYMFAANQEVKWGLASLTESLRASNDEGYWGVYRHRLGSVDDEFTSPYASRTETTNGKVVAEHSAQRPVIKIPERIVQSGSPKIIRGRLRLSNLPNNICFVREGQRQPKVAKEELGLWLDKIAPHARSWIQHLDEQRHKNGVLSFSTHVGHEVPSKEASPLDLDHLSEADAFAETNQLAFFLDLACFELAGRSHKGHVHLRKTVMEVYGPGGPMDGIGRAELFVELAILKSGELDAEYIGCAEGTGLMFLEKM